MKKKFSVQDLMAGEMAHGIKMKELKTEIIIDAHVDSEEIHEGNPDELVSDKEAIVINFNYPLTDATKFTFTHEGGFTLKDFVHSVHEGYQKIYDSEKDPGCIRMTYNRSKSTGPYGIWGHELGNLYLESYKEIEPGVFSLGMGS
jgi:hypothetical protein